MTRNELITLFEESQLKYNSNKDRSFLKDSSQFFTPINIANKMLHAIDLDSISNLNTIKILEPAAGCGILILVLILYLIDNTNISNIEIVIYELDKDLCNILNNNFKFLNVYINKNTNIHLTTSINNDNFILAHSTEWNNQDYTGKYDIIISNPPFSKINQSSEEAIIMKNIVYGQPNIYTLFIGMCLKLLAVDGIFTLLSPRNYLSGTYSKKLRKYIFDNFNLIHIHSFDNRNIFKFVNQEIIISTYINNKRQNKVNISHNGNFELKAGLNDIIYNNKTLSIIIPTGNDSIHTIAKFKQMKYSMKDLGVKVSVGPVVQFRNSEFLSRNTYADEFAPLLISNDIQKNNVIGYFSRRNNPRRKTHNKSIKTTSKHLLPNDNYLIIRKVTARDDKNILVPAVLEQSYFDYKVIGLDNNLIYIHSLDPAKSLNLSKCYGLYCYFNSIYFEEYYSLINGTHTINISDFNGLKLPSMDLIESMGDKLIRLNMFDKKTCSDVMDKYIFN